MILRPSLPAKSTCILLLIFLASLLATADEGARSGRIMLLPLENLSPAELDGPAAAEFDQAAQMILADLSARLGEEALLAEKAQPDYPENPLNRTEAGRFALDQGADLLLSGYYALQERDGAYFTQLRFTLQDLVDPSRNESREFSGEITPAALPERAAEIAALLADDIRLRFPPLEAGRAGQLDIAQEEAQRNLAARRTLTVTIVSPADPEVRLVLHDGSSPGTLADGELSFPVSAESLLRFRLEKPGHYTRSHESWVGTEDLRLKFRRLYPVHRSDIGANLSYMRPFGGLFEHRFRLWKERVTLGYGAGIFLLPEYEDYYLTFFDFELFGGSGDLSADTPLPKFGRFIVESELGANLGLYLLGSADDPFRLLAEANHRVNLYTLPHQEWKSFLVLSGGPGGRLEWNRPDSLWHLGMRFYFAYRTPLGRTESMFGLINGGVAWKR